LTRDDPETRRLAEEAARLVDWKRWGTYLPERQWGTVREDYSPDGDVWGSFPFEQSHVRAYRWGEDGLLGWCDRQARLCFAPALWNTRDPILKERLFGLNGREGNHGEDVKEHYFYLDALPTHAYAKALYCYPQVAFPYDALREGNARRTRAEPELEIDDLDVFAEERFFAFTVEYAKRSAEDILVRLTAVNRGPEPAPLHVLPTIWLRNTWAWGRSGEGYGDRGTIRAAGSNAVAIHHPTLGDFTFTSETPGAWLFADNESNDAKLWGTTTTRSAFPKDSFHDAVTKRADGKSNPDQIGTKVAVWSEHVIGPGEEVVWRLRLRRDGVGPARAFGAGFDRVFEQRIAEADRFWELHDPARATEEERRVARQAQAGLLWTKQFYHYVVQDWLEGDPTQPPPPESRWHGKNVEWRQHLYNRDVVSVPDKWEYPWYAAWDLAFHMVPFARFDLAFARGQLELFLREWYLHPNGQLPAYEWNLSDVNPPIHAWAAWRVFKLSGARESRDHPFLEHVFQKLLMNFTWWVNRKDELGRNLFGGGFLGLDNIGLFDRSSPMPHGRRLEQADGTAWMAFYCVSMLGIATDLARHDRAYADLASKFFEHFVAIAAAMNTDDDHGLWDEEDGFYYDELRVDGTSVPVRVRSMVGLVPLFGALVIEDSDLKHMPSFGKRMQWFLENRPALARNITFLEGRDGHERRLLAIPTKERLVRVLKYVLDPEEFLSPYGVRSVSRYHLAHPVTLTVDGEQHELKYVPGESDSGLFGGNSNWRGPVWLPMNFLLVEALERYHHF
jgi:hypothetical protein